MSRSAHFAITASFALTASVLGTAGKPAAAQQAPIIYAVEYTTGSAWKAGKPAAQQNLGAHFKYFVKQYKAKTLLMGGPFGDNTGGLAVISVGSDKEAQEFAKNDPACTLHVLVAHLHRWNPKFNQLASAQH